MSHEPTSARADRRRASIAARPPQPVLLPLDDGGSLSGLLIEPGAPVRGTVVALHGVGMSSRYFDVDEGGRSFLASAAQQGLQVLALDRPGYGASRTTFPDGLSVAHQGRVIAGALRRHFEQTGTPPGGLTVLGHSFGGKVGLALAALPQTDVANVEVSGLGYRYAVDPAMVVRHDTRSSVPLHWGPLQCYPAGTFLLAVQQITQAVPATEVLEALRWRDTLARVGAHIRCHVHFSFAEHEKWWHCADADQAELARLLPNATVTFSRVPDAGHNASLGYAAPAYHRDVVDRLLESLRRPA